MKRIILYISMLFAASPLFAYDFSAVLGKGDSLYYNIISDSTVEVTYDVKVNLPTRFNFGGHIVIPTTVTHGGKNYRVTKIGDMAFRHCPLIDSVTIPEGVESIGKYAFQYCTGLQWVNPFPASLKEIGESAFLQCKLLEVRFTAPSCLIGSGAFMGCKQLREVILPHGYASLGSQCFSLDSSLCSIQMPDSMDFISNGCFMKCVSLKSIVIPRGVRIIDANSFSFCRSLVTCEFSTPNTLDSIGFNAFSNDSSLLRMDLSKTRIKVLTNGVFEYCVSLQELKLPNTLKIISYLVIHDVFSLPCVVIPESVEYISLGFDAFFARLRHCNTLIFKPTTPPRWFHMTIADKPVFVDDSAFFKDTVYVPCGYVQTYRNANDKLWYIVEHIEEVEFAEREIVLDSVCASEVQQKYGFYPDHSGTYCRRIPSGFACDSMAIFKITLATLPTLDDSTVNVEPNKEDTSVLWTWEGTGYAYNVYRDGDYVTTVEQPSYLDTNIMFNVQYCYNFAPVNEKYCEGKWSTTNCYTMLRDTTGVLDVKAQQPLSLFPNPTKRLLFLTSGERYDNRPYEVTDMTGRIVLQGNYNATEGIRVSGLAKGFYLLRMEEKVGKFGKN